jgi:hypothetical protein
VLILNGHRLIEEVLEVYVRRIFQNRRALDPACLTFEQKLGLVLEHIDLPSWRDDEENDEDDNVDYRIAEEMLGNIKLLNKLRHVISQQILNCVQLGTLSRHATTHDLKSKVSQCLGLPPNTTDKELMEKTRGDILCLHAYLKGFMESTFEGGAN